MGRVRELRRIYLHLDNERKLTYTDSRSDPGARVKLSLREVIHTLTPSAPVRTRAAPDPVSGPGYDLPTGLRLLLLFKDIFSC